MSGENRRFGGWLLPVIVVAVGAYFLVNAAEGGTLSAVRLGTVNWIGLALMAVGAVLALFMKRNLLKLAGLLFAAVGAIMVICL